MRTLSTRDPGTSFCPSAALGAHVADKDCPCPWSTLTLGLVPGSMAPCFSPRCVPPPGMENLPATCPHLPTPPNHPMRGALAWLCTSQEGSLSSGDSMRRVGGQLLHSHSQVPSSPTHLCRGR